MSRTVYTSLLYRGFLTAGTPVSVGPWAGFRVVVRDVVVIASGSAGNVLLADPSFGPVLAAVTDTTVLGYAVGHWKGDQVLRDGASLFIEAVTNDANVSVSGWLLVQP